MSALDSAVYRVNTRFSANGKHAGCIAGDDDGSVHLELWTLTEAGPRCRRRVRTTHAPDFTIVQPTDDGRALVVSHQPGIQRFALLAETGEPASLGEFPPGNLRILPATGGALALGIATAGGRSTGYLIEERKPVQRKLFDIAGTVVGRGVPLGRRLVFGLHGKHQPRPLAIDPATGTASTMDDYGHPGWQPLTGRGGVLLAALRTPGGQVLGRFDGETMRPLPPVSARGALAPFTLAPASLGGAGIAAATVTGGAGSRLTLLRTDTGQTRDVELPSGVQGGAGGWTEHGLWFVHSSPNRPATFHWVRPTGLRRTGRPVARPAGARARDERWIAGRVETFAGAAGPIEAVVIGPDWRHSERVIIALHGGPRERWTLAFNRFFQAMAAAGTTIVAPNQRGSTGYGAAHERAIVGAWGGPDLADIVAIGRTIAGSGNRPALYGVSYGAYLALLCAAEEPELWARCAALSPCRSPESLYPEANGQVRTMIERTGGLGRGGERDIAALAPRISTPLLLVHGVYDETVPVGHSRAMAAALRDAGRTVHTSLAGAGDADVVYLERPDRGHGTLGEHFADPVLTAVAGFLGRPRCGEEVTHGVRP